MSWGFFSFPENPRPLFVRGVESLMAPGSEDPVVMLVLQHQEVGHTEGREAGPGGGLVVQFVLSGRPQLTPLLSWGRVEVREGNVVRHSPSSTLLTTHSLSSFLDQELLQSRSCLIMYPTDVTFALNARQIPWHLLLNKLTRRDGQVFVNKIRAGIEDKLSSWRECLVETEQLLIIELSSDITHCLNQVLGKYLEFLYSFTSSHIFFLSSITALFSLIFEIFIFTIRYLKPP